MFLNTCFRKWKSAAGKLGALAKHRRCTGHSSAILLLGSSRSVSQSMVPAPSSGEQTGGRRDRKQLALHYIKQWQR